jgi:hypothetical protein
MKRVITTISIVLCAASAFADNHCEYRGESNNGNHNGYYRKHDSHRWHGCGNEHVVQRSTIIYRPEYRSAEPRISISLHTPELLVSFLSGR